MPSFAAVQIECECTGLQVTTPAIFHYYMYETIMFTQLDYFVFFSQNTPLHLSARGGQLEICRLLLQCNADVHAKDRL